MIKKYFVLLFFFFLTIGHAQSPEKFTYQSIIKTSAGYLLKNQDVGLKISVLFNSSNGIAVYSEEHTVESNNNGLVTLIIGEGVSSDVFSDIDWGGGEFFLKVEVDPEGGVNYVMEQTSQLLSVPYALYAGNSGSNLNLLGQDYINLTGQTLTINKVDLANDVDGVLPVVNGGTGSSTAPMVGVITAVDATDARLILGLGSAATTDSSDYATAAQGVLADTALQDATVFATAAQGVLADTALQDATVFATAAQGVLADTALQDATVFATAAQGVLADTALQDATVFATAAQGVLADTALQDATVFATAAQGVLADTALQDATVFATAAQGVLADTALQDATVFATAAQGVLADTALQDATVFATAAQGVLADTALQDATVFATAAQGATADAALPAANVSTFGATLIDDADASAARTTLGLGTAATSNALTFGIADTNALKVDQTGDAADNDFAKFTANGIEGRDASEMRTDLELVIGTNVLAEKAIGIADNNLIEVDDADAADNDFAKFTANGIEGRDASEMRTDLELVIGTNVLAEKAIGIADNNLIEVDDADAADNDFAKFTANGIEGRDASEMRTDLELVIGTNVLAEKAIGIADNNLIEVDDADAADNDFAKFTANGIEGRDASEMRTDLELVIGTNVLAEKAIGIADNNLIEVDDADAADNDFAKFTANGIEGRDASEMRTDLDLVIGTNVQAFSSQLTDISGLSRANGSVIVGDGSNFVSETPSSARTSLGFISGIIEMDGVTSVAPTISGISANSIVTISFKSGKNGRQIVSVVPSTNTITITLSGPSSSNAEILVLQQRYNIKF